MSAQPDVTTSIIGIVLVCLVGAYLLVGLCVVGYIFFFRGPVLSRLPRAGMLWEQRYHKRNSSWFFLSLTGDHPIGLLLNILFWPAWLLFYLDAKEAEDEGEGEPRYHGPTRLDDDPPRDKEV